MHKSLRIPAAVAALALIAGTATAHADALKDPVITEVHANADNTLLHIIGANFSEGIPKLSLGSGGLPLAIALATPTQIDAVLPAGVPSGSYLLSLKISKSTGKSSDGEDVRSDEFWVTLGGAGSQGPAGQAGPQGPAGQTGPAGPKGDPGSSGPPGPAGVAGPQGLVGLTGPKGDTGAVGPQGLQGVAGPTGSTGPAGATGPIGPKGADGINGANGTLWAQARAGALLQASTTAQSLTLAAGFSYWISARVPVQGAPTIAPTVVCTLAQNPDSISSAPVSLDVGTVTVNPKLTVDGFGNPSYAMVSGTAQLNLGAAIMLPASGGNVTVTLSCESDEPSSTSYSIPMSSGLTSWPLLRALRLNTLEVTFSAPG